MSEYLFYGHGKILLTGEYFVLDGAKALGLPTQMGQTLKVKYRPSSSPKLFWKSYDYQNQCWLEAVFELWHFNIVGPSQPTSEMLALTKILKQARKQNIHFLRENQDVYVKTYLEFPRDWGLGSSSTLIYNIAQWAYISPYELLSKTFGGSGYDVACAQSLGPIFYEKKASGPHWKTTIFNPHFKEDLFFVHLNKKQDSRLGMQAYYAIEETRRKSYVERVSQLSEEIALSINLKEFESLVLEHESIVSEGLGFARLQETTFKDYWGVVKSLGAWGGDLALVTSDRGIELTKDYFASKGYHVIISFDELILQKFGDFALQLKKNLNQEITCA